MPDWVDRRAFMTLGAAVAATFTSARTWAASGRYALATGTPGGADYPVGIALATLFNVQAAQDGNLALTARATSGAEENLALLAAGEADFAIVQALYGAWAWNGTGPYRDSGPKRRFRAIAGLWRNAEHFLIDRSVAASGTVADLASIRGQPVAFGGAGSGARGSTLTILRNIGFEEGAFEFVEATYAEAAALLAEGRVAAMSAPGGVPVPAVAAALGAAGRRFALLGFSDAEREAADGGLGVWSAFDIPPDAYPGLTATVHSIAQQNFLAVRADTDAAVVYRLARILFEGGDFLGRIHPAAAALTADGALQGLPVPLHEGAFDHFLDVGVDVPRHLEPV